MKHLMILLLATSTFAPTGAAAEEENFIEAETVYYEMHPLNDAWMGLPVRTSEGVKVGVVIDAPINDKGIVTSILVAPHFSYDQSSAEYLHIDGRNAYLLDTHVKLSSDAETDYPTS